jgi:predicted RNA-binding protein with PUA domain
MPRQDRADERDADYEDFLDHERLALDRFRCPQCGMPLELIELRLPAEERLRDPDRIELIAACRRCEIGMSKEEYARHRVV